MVCLGNICRFPLLESILKSKLPKKTFEVESAGTEGFHIGKYTDPRSIEIVAQIGINITKQTVRKFIREDFKRFDRIYEMDRGNLKNVKQITITVQELNMVALLVENKEFPDPYYGNDNEFKKMFDLIDNTCERMNKKILN